MSTASSGSTSTERRSSTPPPASAPPRRTRPRVEIVFDSRTMPLSQISHLSHRAPRHTWPQRPSVAEAIPLAALPLIDTPPSPSGISPPELL
jgi:hypothetical protein